MENVYLGDVAAALPHETIVTVVGRCTIVDEGPRRYEDPEHAVLLPEEAYAQLKAGGPLGRARRQARPRAAGVTPLDLVRSEQAWAERATRFERLAEDTDAARLDASVSRRLGELCRQFEAELEGLRQRAEAGDAEPARAA